MTYYFGIPIEYADDISKTTSMLAFEAYRKREVRSITQPERNPRETNMEQDLYETHFNSAAMGKFLNVIPDLMTTGLDLSHYAPVAGFLDRDTGMQECGIMQDIRIRCEHDIARQTVLARGKILAQALELEDRKTLLTYMVFESLDDVIGVRIFGRWSNRHAMEVFLRRSDVKDFWMAAKDDVASMESRNYVPNKKGWLHR